MERIKEIIEEIKEKNFDSFDELYNLTNKIIYYIIIQIVKRKEIAEELMQETYLKFIENIHKCDTSYSPKTYLLTIARNLAINEYNKNKKLVLNEEIIDLKMDETITSNVDLGIIKYLEGMDQEIVSMHIIGEMKFREIAHVLDKPLGTVLWAYQRAIRKLKKKVGENNEI